MNKMLVISGAGLSTESGIRTFRTDEASGEGYWNEFKVSDVCMIDAFDAGFDLYTGAEYKVIGGLDEWNNNLYERTHDFYNQRRQELQTVEPNAAHRKIAAWDALYNGRVHHVTTNVDDLLERAGVPHEDIIHVHGYLPRVRYKIGQDDEDELVDIGYSSLNYKDYYWAKPDVVFFGEGAPEYQKMYNTHRDIGKGDLVILVGASNQVIDFYWEICPMVFRGATAVVVNPNLTMNEKYMLEKYDIEYFECGAVEAFTSDKMNEIVTKAMESL